MTLCLHVYPFCLCVCLYILLFLNLYISFFTFSIYLPLYLCVGFSALSFLSDSYPVSLFLCPSLLFILLFYLSFPISLSLSRYLSLVLIPVCTTWWQDGPQSMADNLYWFIGLILLPLKLSDPGRRPSTLKTARIL